MDRRTERVLEAVREISKCMVTHLESVPVTEMEQRNVAWTGVVEVFELKRHPLARRCYAWSHREGNHDRVVTVLELPPVDSPRAAVRAALARGQQS